MHLNACFEVSLQTSKGSNQLLDVMVHVKVTCATWSQGIVQQKDYHQGWWTDEYTACPVLDLRLLLSFICNNVLAEVTSQHWYSK